MGLNEHLGIEILPRSIRGGVPITVFVDKESIPYDKRLEVIPLKTQYNVPQFVVNLVPDHESTRYKAEFTIQMPGVYELQLGVLRERVVVDEQTYLSFDREFGFFSGSVIILVGVMILWLIKTKMTNKV